MIKAVIFDLDETLIGRVPTMRRFLVTQHKRFSSLLLSSEKDFVERVFEYQNGGYVEMLAAYIRACAELGEPKNLPEELLFDLKEHYGFSAVLLDGVKPMLASLARHYMLGIISNGVSREQNAKLDATGIRKYFQAITISEEVGCGKPDPRIFSRCASDLNVAPSECVFVGDHPDNDVLAARKFGMSGVWVQTARFVAPRECEGIVESASQIEALLIGWGEPNQAEHSIPRGCRL